MKVRSCNEWDTLKVCVVGDATGAKFPEHDEVFALNDTGTAKGQFPQSVIDESNEDLQTLADTLTKLGVEVLRPTPIDFNKMNVTYDWKSDGMYNYCPRDVLLVVDDLVIECPMTYRSRQFESAAYDYIRRSAIKDDVRWIAAPRPRLLLAENYAHDDQVFITKDEPVFDAANVCRVGNDILYLVSNSGNRLGGQWLQNVLGKQYKVHLLENLYAHAHIDSTITVLRDGLVVLNSARVTHDNLPPLFNSWEKIWVTDDDIVPTGYHIYPYASKWIAINMLSVDATTVICDKNQPALIKKLEHKGMTVVPLELRHARTLGGGFHCVTLDLVRG